MSESIPKKTVRFEESEQKNLESIMKRFQIPTENKTFKFLVNRYESRENEIARLETLVEKLEEQNEMKRMQLKLVQENLKAIDKFKKMKL